LEKKQDSDILYILDSLNYRIQQVDINGNFINKINTLKTIFHTMSIDFNRKHFFLAYTKYLVQINEKGDLLYYENFNDLRDIHYYKDSIENKEYLAILKLKSLMTYELNENGILGDRTASRSSGNTLIKKDRSWEINDNSFYNQFSIDTKNRLIYIAVADKNSFCLIKKYDYYGVFQDEWKACYSNNTFISELTTDENGHIYVLLNAYNAHTEDSIKKYTSDGELITTFGSSGPGMFSEPKSVCASPDGLSVFVADTGNNRIQIFSQIKLNEGITKAIIIAGYGPEGNNIWDETKMNTNLAYESMLANGIKPEEIYYLSASKKDLNQDIGNDGVYDIDGFASLKELSKIVKENVNDADLLVIYMAGHGHVQGYFQLNGNGKGSKLNTSDLKTMLEQFKNKLIFVIDACYSGAFIESLSDKNRIIISSVDSDEKASFDLQGIVSFSHPFWTSIYKGYNVQEAFEIAKLQTEHEDTYSSKTPQMRYEINSKQVCIGRGNIYVVDPPIILDAGIIPSDINESTATIYADIDNDHYYSTTDVIAVIKSLSPSVKEVKPDTIFFEKKEKGRFEILHDNFSIPGIYNVVITASDKLNNFSSPVVCQFEVKKTDYKKAVIIVGKTEALFDKKYVNDIIPLVMDALLTQGFYDNNIVIFGPNGFFFNNKNGKTYSPNCYDLEMLKEGIDSLSPGIEDLVIYLLGETDSGYFLLNNQEKLSSHELSESLNNIQNSIQGKATIIFESNNAKVFMSQLSLHDETKKKLIFISSITESQNLNYLTIELISFSNLFWIEILKGNTLDDAFIYAALILSNLNSQIPFTNSQRPFIDTNDYGNKDIEFAKDYHIGYGIKLAAYEEPFHVSSVSPEISLTGVSSSCITATVIPSQLVDKVFGIINTPVKTKSYSESIPQFELTYNNNTGQFEGKYDGFDRYGDYIISIFARRKDDRSISNVVTTKVIQTVGPDCYEDDDILSRASVIFFDNETKRTFHSKDDVDWFMIYALEGEKYHFTYELDVDVNYNLVLYEQDGMTFLKDDDFLGMLLWTASESGIYYFSFNIQLLR